MKSKITTTTKKFLKGQNLTFYFFKFFVGGPLWLRWGRYINREEQIRGIVSVDFQQEKAQLWCLGGPDAQMMWLRTCSRSRSSYSSHTDRSISVHNAKGTTQIHFTSVISSSVIQYFIISVVYVSICIFCMSKQIKSQNIKHVM